MGQSINQVVMMSSAKNFKVLELNPQSHETIQPNITKALAEHNEIKQLFEQAGMRVIQVPAPQGENCQDGVYTANWALVRRDKAILANLPPQRKGEVSFAETYLRQQQKKIIHMPQDIHFSGQGDALPCGNYLFCGSGYRSDKRAHQFLADTLGYTIISLQTIPLLDDTNKPVVNHVTGWPDSFFYDIDLALSLLRGPTETEKGIIAWCPEAFTEQSVQTMQSFNEVEKIEVSLDEAVHGFACNLVSTGDTIIMSAHAPHLKAACESRGFTVLTPQVSELIKGGGFIRCITLTLDNE